MKMIEKLKALNQPYVIARLVLALAIVANAFVFSRLLLNNGNSLFLQNNWTVQKLSTEVLTMGGAEFLLSRAPLAYNELDLGQWWGHQKIIWNQESERTGFLIRTRFYDDSRLSIVLGNDGDSLYTIHLSNHPDFFNGLEKKSLHGTDEKLVPYEWELRWDRRFDIVIDLNEGWVRVDQKRYLIDAPSSLRGEFSLQGGTKDTVISKVKLKMGEQLIFETSFQNPKNRAQLFLYGLMTFIFFHFLLKILFFKNEDGLGPMTIQLSTLIILGGLYFVDSRFLMSKAYFVPTKSILRVRKSIPLYEYMRYYGTLLWYQRGVDYAVSRKSLRDKGHVFSSIHEGPVLCEPQCRYLYRHFIENRSFVPEGKKLVVILGGSQTIGSGAIKLEDTFYARMLQELNDESIILLNLAASGARTHELYDDYHRTIENLRPEVILHNWGINDSPEDIEKGLSLWLTLAKKIGSQVLIFEEANNKELGDYSDIIVDSTHEAMREMASNFDIEVIPLDRLLVEHQKEYRRTLWWDMAHMNNRGHEYAGKIWAKALAKILSSENKKAP